jgi:iron(III) transport system substrate-binding protein
MKKVGMFTFVLLLFYLSGLFLFMGQMAEGKPEASGTINYYTSSRRDLVDKIVEDFEAIYPDIKVNVYRSGTGEVIAKLQAEMEAGAAQADLVSVTDMAFFMHLVDKDLLYKYTPPNAASIPDEFKYGDGRYYERFIMTVAIGYNTLSVKTKPTGWKDLLNPEYKNRIGIPNPVYSGVALTMLGTLTQTQHWDGIFTRG